MTVADECRTVASSVVRRVSSFAAATAVALLVGAGAAHAQQGSGGDGNPAQPAPTSAAAAPTTTQLVATTTTLPAGCSPSVPPTAVFLATAMAKDSRTVRFSVSKVTSGSIDGYAVGGLVDVDFDDIDRPLVKVGDEYAVAVAVNPATKRLTSKLRDAPPLFGESQVVGVDNKPTNCPAQPDLVITTKSDGTRVDTGMLAGLSTEKKQIAWSFLEPALIVMAVFVALVLLKHFVTGTARVTGYGIRRLRRRAAMRAMAGRRPPAPPTAAPPPQ
jgi:hypothetical protein